MVRAARMAVLMTPSLTDRLLLTCIVLAPVVVVILLLLGALSRAVAHVSALVP